MNKQTLIILIFIAAIGGLVFHDQVLAIFAGMTPLAALKLITDYVLHVAVVTIIGFMLFGLPEIVKPWMRLLRQKQRAQRRGRIPQRVTTPRAPRINKDQVLMWLASQLPKHEGKDMKSTNDAPPSDIHFKL